MRLHGPAAISPLSLDRWGLRGGVAIAVLLLSVCLFLIFKMDIFWLRGDQMRWLWLVEKMYLGRFELADLWIDESNTRAPACYLFFALNGYLFKLNMQLEQVARAARHVCNPGAGPKVERPDCRQRPGSDWFRSLCSWPCPTPHGGACQINLMGNVGAGQILGRDTV